jgi:sortase A
LRKVKVKRQKIKNLFSQSPIFRRAAIVLGTLFVVFLLVFSFFALKQNSFEKEVHAMQTDGVKQIKKMEKENKNGSKIASADYTAADVRTLSPRDLQKVDAAQQINQFGSGLLEIPSISLTLPILEGMTQANLSVGAGTAKADQVPGKGNFVLLGHYMTNRGVLFGGLRYVQKGNEVTVTYHDRKAIYEVTDIKVIHQSEVQYMEDEKGKDGILTLITCDSSREGTPNRLIVQAIKK